VVSFLHRCHGPAGKLAAGRILWPNQCERVGPGQLTAVLSRWFLNVTAGHPTHRQAGPRKPAGLLFLATRPGGANSTAADRNRIHQRLPRRRSSRRPSDAGWLVVVADARLHITGGPPPPPAVAVNISGPSRRAVYHRDRQLRPFAGIGRAFGETSLWWFRRSPEPLFPTLISGALQPRAAWFAIHAGVGAGPVWSSNFFSAPTAWPTSPLALQGGGPTAAV